MTYMSKYHLYAREMLMPDEMRSDPKTFPKVIRTGEPGGKGQIKGGKRNGVLFVAQTRELPCCYTHTPAEPPDRPVSN